MSELVIHDRGCAVRGSPDAHGECTCSARAVLERREIEKELKAMEALVDKYLIERDAARDAVRAAFLEGHDRGYDRRGQGERDWLDSRAYLRLQEGTGE